MSVRNKVRESRRLDGGRVQKRQSSTPDFLPSGNASESCRSLQESYDVGGGVFDGSISIIKDGIFEEETALGDDHVHEEGFGNGTVDILSSSTQPTIEIDSLLDEIEFVSFSMSKTRFVVVTASWSTRLLSVCRCRVDSYQRAQSRGGRRC